MKKTNIFIIFIVLWIFISSCSNEESNTNIQDISNEISVENNENIEVNNNAETSSIYSDWTEETHSKTWELNYDTVFPQNSVNRIDIVISDENWEALNNNMEWIYGSFWKWDWKIDDNADSSELNDLIYVETQVYFNDTQWYNVWMKFKWHSSLKSTWTSWNYKLPFKLDFDEFEDNYEELENQRFYWFKKLSFSSNFKDDSFLHEKIAPEAFEKAWLIVPETAFYRVYVDYWEGSKYFWLYTAIEVIDNTVIDKFWDDSWNIYEGEWVWTKLSTNTYNKITSSFQKKNNEEEADWSDIQELSARLNSDLRTTDIDSWKQNLEEVFDVDVFLNWLAVNSTIQNWDTYWIMTHNFYLYNNPETEKLIWIPRDNNESFSQWKKWIVTLTANWVSDEWPLIRYLLDDEEYREQYVSYVKEFNDNVLNTDEFIDRVTELHELIEPYVIWDNWEVEGYTHLKNENAFTSSLSTLISFIKWRIEAASSLSLGDNWEYDASNSTTQSMWWRWWMRPWWEIKWDFKEWWERMPPMMDWEEWEMWPPPMN